MAGKYSASARARQSGSVCQCADLMLSRQWPARHTHGKSRIPPLPPVIPPQFPVPARRAGLSWQPVPCDRIKSRLPGKYKTFVQHLYNAAPTSSTLVQHCINVIQMFCVRWAAGDAYRPRSMKSRKLINTASEKGVDQMLF